MIELSLTLWLTYWRIAGGCWSDEGLTRVWFHFGPVEVGAVLDRSAAGGPVARLRAVTRNLVGRFGLWSW